jgi:glutathione S-transferase
VIYADHGSPSFPDELSAYTSPTIITANGEYIMDSRKIAEALEKAYPSPGLHLDSPYLIKLEGIMPELVGTIRGVYYPLVPQRLLSEASRPYWYETRVKTIGMPLEQMAKEKGGPAAWKAAEPHFAKVNAMLAEHPEGPFFMGETVSYVDFVWAGFLIFTRRIGEFEKLLEASGNADMHLKLLEAVEPWSKRDDY